MATKGSDAADGTAQGSSWRLLRVAERVPVPWKNGGGTTFEVAREPGAGALDAFDWRISTARVDAPGPFSHFAGVERTLMILDGAMELSIGSSPPRTLDAASAPVTFDGEAPASARPLAPTLDLNLMTRRGRCAARLETVSGGTTHLVANESTLVTLVVCVRPGVRVLHAAGAVELGRHDACLADGPHADGARVAVDATGAACLITIQRHGP